mmetsp:Transcript_19086/g.45687  ORF Transcript_19086/g.45687 Transcript_19086/m.45687 type:complete len:273 (+) Transcript_19086:3-821(+)
MRFYSTRHFPELNVLQENWKLLRDEALERCKVASLVGPDRPSGVYPNGVYTGTEDVESFVEEAREAQAWSAAFQVGQRSTTWFNYPLIFNGQSLTDQCPNSVRVLTECLGDRIRVAGFSWLRPDGYIKPHVDEVGPQYGSLTYHLGLVVPEPTEGRRGAVLTVDGVDRVEHEGQPLIFNATNLHEACNDADGERIILYLDWRVEAPELDEDEEDVFQSDELPGPHDVVREERVAGMPQVNTSGSNKLGVSSDFLLEMLSLLEKQPPSGVAPS